MVLVYPDDLGWCYPSVRVGGVGVQVALIPVPFCVKTDFFLWMLLPFFVMSASMNLRDTESV